MLQTRRKGIAEAFYDGDLNTEELKRLVEDGIYELNARGLVVWASVTRDSEDDTQSVSIDTESNLWIDVHRRMIEMFGVLK